ncbi:hypothetical protein [Ornithinimicrobium sp. LYQ103]|uniref:hypothetical protein n=1 Tax=Ornithinimicrobium sp. LYQ103 TaxID=3378796 RepID=UPI003854E496
MHRHLIVAGLLVSVLLVTCGLFLDGAGDRWTGLADYVWSLATAVTIGTLALAVLEDVRSWGVSWKILKAEEHPLTEQAAGLVGAVGAAVGLTGAWGRSLTLDGARQQASALARPLSALTNARYEHNRYRLGLREPAPDPFETWETVSECVAAVGVDIYRDLLLRDEAAGDAERAAQDLSETLSRLSSGLSTGARATVSQLELRLPRLHEQVLGAATGLAALRDGRPWPPEQLQESILGIWSTMASLENALDLIDYEMKSGAPHPYRG